MADGSVSCCGVGLHTKCEDVRTLMGLKISFVLELGGGGVWGWVIVHTEQAKTGTVFPKGRWLVLESETRVSHAGKGEWHGQLQC
jgi:hypothetical protein